MRRLLLMGLVAACAHNVAQDAATGADGRIKGARPIKLDNGEGVARGIVTYPGGDRVDWKSIELPPGKQGTLELKMTWTTPRPGLKVSFDVFDQYEAPAQLAALHHHKRSRDGSIDHAKGTYFVRVFAPNRGDAATYKLVASFHEDPPPIVVGNIDVPDPPRLAAVPPPPTPCDTFDSKNAACFDQCPDGAPATWHGCQNTCTTPDPNKPACQHTMACPTPPDQRVDACMIDPGKHWTACPDFTHPDPTNPLCASKYIQPIEAQIIFVEQTGDGVLITLDVGSNDKIDTSWHVHVLRGSTDDTMANGETKLIRVEKTRAIAKLKLTRDQLSGNLHVRVTPR